jgi:hypothetical protein
MYSIVDHADGPMVGSNGDGVLRYEGAGVFASARIFACHIERLQWNVANTLLFGVTYPGGPFRYEPGVGFERLGGNGLDEDELWAIAVNPRDPFTLLVGGRGGVLHRTTDGGQTWAETGVGLDWDYSVDTIEHAPGAPDVVWVAQSYAGVYRSLDGGLSFSQVYDQTVWTLAALSADVAIFGGGDLVRYDAGGISVIEAGGGGTDFPFVSTTPDGSVWFAENYNGLSRSVDGGVSFVSLGLSSNDNQPVRGVAVDLSNADHFYVGLGLGLLETFDGGAAFREAGAPFPVTALTQDPAGGAIYVGTQGGGVLVLAP